MKSNLEGLKAAYAAATKGEWGFAVDKTTHNKSLVVGEDNEALSIHQLGITKRAQNDVRFIALAHNLTPALISAVDILTRILNAHASGNNGAYMGEAILCPYLAKAAKYVLNDLGVKTYVAED